MTITITERGVKKPASMAIVWTRDNRAYRVFYHACGHFCKRQLFTMSQQCCVCIEESHPLSKLKLQRHCWVCQDVLNALLADRIRTR